MKQFGRQYRLEIGNKTQSIVFNNLRVAFNIEKTITSTPNTAELSIYNLNETHRALITSKQYNLASLHVSYVSDDLRQLFIGEIVNVEIKREDLDFITVLTCSDGYTALGNSVSMKTLSAGATDSDIINASLADMGVPKGSVTLPNDRKLPRGKTMMCDSKRIIEHVAMNNNADWSIQDQQLVILPKNSVLNDSVGFVLSQETGLVGSPQRTDKGIDLVTLCNPHFKIGGLVRLQSIVKEYNGDYKITKLTHSGDILGGEWVSKITCSDGTFQKV